MAMSRLTRLMIAVFVLAAGCTAAGPAAQPVQTTFAWGPEVKGLRARLQAPAEIEQNAPLAVAFELQCDPRAVPAGITGFDRYLAYTHLRLILTRAATGRAIEMGTQEFSGPFAGPNRGQNASPLNETPIKPIQTEFPLRAAGEGLKPGVYDCVVSYASDRGKRGYTERTRPKGLWLGQLRTAPVRLTIKPEVPRDVTFQVPMRLRLTPDQKVVFLPGDAERVTVALGNGMFLCTRITRDTGLETLTSRTPEPGGPNPIDDWRLADSHPVNGKAQYTIEVFATGDPPHHMWDPGPGANDYKTL